MPKYQLDWIKIVDFFCLFLGQCYLFSSIFNIHLRSKVRQSETNLYPLKRLEFFLSKVFHFALSKRMWKGMKDRVKYSWDKVLVTFLVIFQIESFGSIYMFFLLYTIACFSFSHSFWEPPSYPAKVCKIRVSIAQYLLQKLSFTELDKILGSRYVNF